MRYTVHELAILAHVSVRTLHYYDEIGLLTPSSIGKNGYRYYEQPELIRLQQILFFRELEFSLDDIKRILSRPNFSVVESLREQKKLMLLKQERLSRLMRSIDKTIRTMTNEQQLQDDELYDAFEDDDVKEYQGEVKQRWGNTEAYRQSMAKVGKMTKKEMEELKIKGKIHTQKIADAMDKGVDHPDVQSLIAEHYQGIQFFYDCPLEMYRNLGQMYVDDARFTAYYDKFRPGLAVFLRDAIAYFVKAQGKKVK